MPVSPSEIIRLAYSCSFLVPGLSLRWPKITVVLPHQLQYVVPDTNAEPVRCGAASRLMDQRTTTTILISGQKPLRLPHAHS